MTEKFGGKIGRRYAKIDLGGKEGLKRGEINRFEGFGKNLRNRIITALEFSPESQRDVQRRVLDEVERIGRELGIEFFIAGKDFPMHSTVEEGLYEDNDESERAAIFQDVKHDKKMEELCERKLTEPVVFKYLLIDKGNVILTSVEIPEAIRKMREELAALYLRYGLKPLPMENILHITIGRMTEIPEDDKIEQFKKYQQAMIKLRHAISKEPLNLSADRISKGSTYEFLTGR